MKKILYGAVLLAFAMMSAGCSLEETPESLIPESEAYATPTMVYVNTVANLYTQLYKRYKVGEDNFQYLEDETADLLWRPGRGSDWIDGGKHQNCVVHYYTPSTDMVKSIWNDCYSDIALCNKALAKLEEVKALGTVEEGVLKQYVAEVRAIRAFYYMQLCNIYGRIPVVTDPSLSVNDIAQSERSATLKFLQEEITACIADLPAQFACSLDAEYYARFTKGAAVAMLAQLAINAGVYSKDNWNDGTFVGGYAGKTYDKVTALGNDVKFTFGGKTLNAWDTVIACMDALEEMGYLLNYASWNNLFKNGNEGNKENIFIHPYDDNSYRFTDDRIICSVHYNHSSTLGFSSWNGVCTTLTTSAIFGVDEDLTKYKDPSYKHTNPDADIKISYDDPRFPLTFYYGNLSLKGVDVASGISADIWPNGCYMGSTVKLNFATSTDWEQYETKWSGYRIKKFEFDPSTTASNSFNADRAIYRMGSIYLWAAEAYLRTGYPTAALDLVNEVRERAGAPKLTAVTIEDILDERARELMWETVGRRSDLIRVGEYTEPTIDKYPGVAHCSQSSDFIVDETGYTIVLPIPATAIELNPKLTQNPGYAGK